MESIWSREILISERKPLKSDRKAEVAVIGAGMAGLLTAFFLMEKGIEVIVLEADRIGGGQTKNTTAKITSQHGLFYTDLIRKTGREKAELYAGANENAIHRYQEIINKYDVKCDFEKIPSYLYSRREEEKLKKEADTAASLGIQSYFTKENGLPFPTMGAVCFEEQAQFNPLKFLQCISEKLEIYENTRAISVKGHKIQTDYGIVEAEHIVFATHYPFLNMPGFYFLRQHQERSYVIALSNVKKHHGMYYSADDNGLSLRWTEDILLLGGGAHRTGKKDCGGAYRMLREQAAEYFPGCQEEDQWSAQDCMPHDDIPFIGRYSAFRPYWYVATGFKKWGMTSSMIAAELIADQICGEKNPYEKLFSPQRVYVGASAKKFFIDAGVSVAGLTQGLFHPGKRCPHMGCRLVWNPEEKSWDCPCHGSRFEANGNLIDNPAQRRKK